MMTTESTRYKEKQREFCDILNALRQFFDLNIYAHE